MAEPNATPEPAMGDGALPTANLVRLIQGAEESNQDRLMKKYLPAFVVSGAVHVILLVGTILFVPAGTTKAESDDILTAVAAAEEKEERKYNLTDPDEGLDSTMKAAVEVDRVAELNIDAVVVKEEPVGVVGAENTTPMDTPSLAGIGADMNNLGITGDAGAFLTGAGGNAGVAVSKAMAGRSGATKEAMLKAGGGNSASEAAVAKGLAWLAREQKADGSWRYDGDASADSVAATGMALLPFLAAGQTHKASKENKYQKNVENGLNFLLKNQKPDGSFNGIMPNHLMYSHAIATVALCECYGMTGDRAKLLSAVQKATNFITAAQDNNGSWGYTRKTEGDTSIVGWQIQALKSAEMCKDVQIDKNVLKKATKFLDNVSGGSNKATYGYRTGPGAPASSLTAVGLLCRYYLDGWGPLNAGMAEGVKGMVVRRPPSENQFDMYYYYYATQVVHFHEGEAWHKDWNPKMRDLLVKLQVGGKTEKTNGSWDPDRAFIGSSCGRVGTTCMALLTLEVYYRHLPLYKRGTGGMAELERGK